MLTHQHHWKTEKNPTYMLKTPSYSEYGTDNKVACKKVVNQPIITINYYTLKQKALPGIWEEIWNLARHSPT